MNKPVQTPCPQCSKKVTWSNTNPFRPFCSERCKLIDLGEWASEGYRVPGEPAPLNQPDMNEEDSAEK